MHEVYMYKVEQHVDLSGEYPDNYLHTHVNCEGNDIALDGMWRVDHVDQFNNSDYDPDDPDTGIYNDRRDVIFYASYGDDVKRGMWHFRLENLAQGNAQVKLFVTCIRARTESNAGHRHRVVVTQRFSDTTHNALAPGANQFDFRRTCRSNFYAVAPGFNFTGDHYNQIFRNWPNTHGRGWTWAFKVNDPHPPLTVYLRCIRKRVAPATGAGAHVRHTHKLPMAFRPNLGGFSTTVHPHNTPVERRYDCDQHAGNYHNYKAMVGAFWIHDPWHVWYLGMDPRPKQRAFSFWWDGHGSNQIYLGALCIRARTGKQIRP